MQRNIAAMAKEEGIEFNWEHANSGNTFNAHRIIHLAQSLNLGNEAKEAFFYSYMTQGLAIGERETIEDVLEPYLIQQGFLQRTPRGRIATSRAWTHFGITPPEMP